MAKLINIGFGNVVNSQKIVAVVNPDAAPVKRMVQSVKGTNSLVDATQGRKTKSVIVTSDDILILSAIQPDTIARIRTDYVHEQQARYRTAIADLEQRIANASTGERVKLNKRLKALNEQAAEIHAYEEKIHHLADQMISIDLDDGVKKNYAIFKDVLAKIK